VTLSPHGKLIPRGELCPLCRKRRRRLSSRKRGRSEYCMTCEPRTHWPLCGRCRVHRREPGASYCPSCVIAVAYIAYPPPGPGMRYSDVVIVAADRWLRERLRLTPSDPDYEQRRAARLQFLQRKHERQRTARIKLLLAKR
jgi:hypothetical protein